MRVLIACEESQTECMVFRTLGHEAYSCDIQEPSGGHIEWHIHGDVLKILDGDCEFSTMDGTTHRIKGQWDMIIAHPPCTHLAVSGARWFAQKKVEQAQAIEFFMRMINAKCDRVAVENPVCIMSTIYRKPDQVIQPWQFGHPETKKTCLWLRGLEPLRPTNIVYDYMMQLPEKDRNRVWWLGSRHAKERSKAYPGIAKAMAEQWGRVEDGDDNR